MDDAQLSDWFLNLLKFLKLLRAIGGTIPYRIALLLINEDWQVVVLHE